MDPHSTSLDAPSSTFTASWTPSKATAFDADNLPRSKVPRAWERKPSQSKSDNGKTKTVWKRYQLRSGPDASTAPENTFQATEGEGTRSPAKVVKKARVASPVKGEGETDTTKTRARRKSAATRYERRKSGYKRKPAASLALDASIMPTFSAPRVSLVQVEPMKDEEHEQRHRLDTVSMEKVHEDASRVESEPQQDLSEEEDSMCEAAEAQLLTEAGLEPIPADFAISPVKKRRRDVVPEKEAEKAVEEDLNDSVMENEDEAVVYADTVQYPVLAELSQIDGHDDREPETPSAPKFEQIVRPHKPACPSIDIFGLDDEDIETPQQAIEEVVDENEDDESSTVPTFAISLNDETVNLGALLAKNDHLAATITDDEIQLEVVENGEEAEKMSPTTADAILSLKDDDESPADSPDELSMDLDATETITTTGFDAFTHLEDDKAKLSSFLRRMAERKEKKSSSSQRRESLQDKQDRENRRDSDVVRKALASPRQVLEEKDKNVSPQRQSQNSTLNLDQMLTSAIVQPATDAEEIDELSNDYQTGSPQRRSFRTRSKLPQSSTQGVVPNKISVRTDGGEKVTLNRSEAQQLADLVKKNTRKNKGASVPAPARLAKLKLESLAAIVDGEPHVVETLLKQGVKNVTWRGQLADYATSPATADLELMAQAEAAVEAAAPKKIGTVQPRLRKLRALGGTNGTPAKKVVQAIQMPDEIEEEKQKVVTAATANAKRKRNLPTLAVTTSNEEPAEVATAIEEKNKVPTTSQKKSKLPPPKKLNLNPSLNSIGGGVSSLQGKENSVALFAGLNSPAKKMSKIPAPSGIPAPSTVSLDLTGGLKMPVKRVRGGVTKRPL